MKTICSLILVCVSCACLAQRNALSLGGEARYQYFHFTDQDWGEAPQDKDGFVLSRFLAHANFQPGKHFRAMVELQASLANGQAQPPSAVDQNPLDLHQAYIDVLASNFTFRIGRQEFSYGSQRLISVREAPNNRQSFDAFKLRYINNNAKLDIFYGLYVPAKPNIFDDGVNNGTRLWGAYATLFDGIDLYYLGLHKSNALFDKGKGAETRHSVGARYFGAGLPFNYDIEGVYQFGDFAQKIIAAWTLSANVSYIVPIELSPQLGLKAEAISGDKDQDDGRLNTFNPLFPKGGYFGLAALIGPYNLFDAHPYIQLKLNNKLSLAVDYDLFWRLENTDALYAVNGKILYAGNAGTSKDIGRQLGFELAFKPTEKLYFRQEFTWFKAGEFLKQAGPGKDILMFGSTATYKF